MTSLKPAEFSNPDGGKLNAGDLTPDQTKMLKEAVHEAGLKATSESQMVSTQAQRLFYEYWNSGGHSQGFDKGKDQFRKCMRMAEEIRQIVTQDFAARVKKHDDALRGQFKHIIQPGSRLWEDWRLPGT